VPWRPDVGPRGPACTHATDGNLRVSHASHTSAAPAAKALGQPGQRRAPSAHCRSRGDLRCTACTQRPRHRRPHSGQAALCVDGTGARINAATRCASWLKHQRPWVLWTAPGWKMLAPRSSVGGSGAARGGAAAAKPAPDAARAAADATPASSDANTPTPATAPPAGPLLDDAVVAAYLRAKGMTAAADALAASAGGAVSAAGAGGSTGEYAGDARAPAAVVLADDAYATLSEIAVRLGAGATPATTAAVAGAATAAAGATTADRATAPVPLSALSLTAVPAYPLGHILSSSVGFLHWARGSLQVRRHCCRSASGCFLGRPRVSRCCPRLTASSRVDGPHPHAE
jgi:hypothetical protein